MEFRLLGPVEVVADGQLVPLPAAKPRALLALLLLSGGRVVSVDGLIDGLWGDEAPDTAGKALQVYVSQLRKAIGADRVLTKPPGYALRVEEGELDLDRFEQLAREGRELLANGDAEAVSERLSEALGLWRGPALAEFRDDPFARDAAARLEDARLGALDERIDADLTLGRHAPLVPELEQLVAAHPARERSAGQLMLALYRSGRQSEALEVYRRTRDTLNEHLGIEPSPELRELERAILQHDPALQITRRPRPGGESPPGSDRAPEGRAGATMITAALIAAAVVVVVVIALALTGRGHGNDPQLRAFVTKVENFLDQSRAGRRAVVATLAAESTCKLTPPAAVRALDRVTRNRQSLLEQAAALSVPSGVAAQQASNFLQQSIQASIEADWHYRDWLLASKRCEKPGTSPDLRAALAADARASRAKKSFVAIFNPLAQRYAQRAWSDWEF
jgi:DNA-binding SARP family transcriptional activator